MDRERHQHLQSIIMLREIVRKWWRAELHFADRQGQVLDWNRGEGLASAAGACCRLARSSREGLRRCNQSVRELHEQFLANRRLRRALVQSCHLRLNLVAAPLYVQDEYEGFLFVEGLLREPLEAPAREALRARLRELVPGAPDVDRTLERLPVLDDDNLEKLTELLEYGTGEIAAYEAERTRPAPSALESPAHAGAPPRFAGIIGRSESLQEIFKVLEKVSNSEATVLINGESGTGKELVARAIHDHGPRRDAAFVVQNCSAFNDNLLESALFGYLRGAFTGAVRDKKGLFETADNGTFFLDEVGDMSPALQVKLLRVLQEGTFLPVGGTQPREVDVRVIAATHKDLGEMVKRGEFREDLYYRINVIRVHLPPLRERRDDLPLLVDHFLRKHHRAGQRARGLAPEALALLGRYAWPGNVRELENELQRLLVLGGDLEWLPVDLISSRIRDAVSPGTMAPALPRPTSGGLHAAVESLEKEMIHQGLLRTGNNKSRLARELGISRSNLILKIARYGLDGGAVPDAEADA